MKFQLIPNLKLTPNVRRDTLNGVPHLVFPVVAIKEGILNNIFYPKEELEKFAQAWNGVPIPVRHPKNNDGSNISANVKEAIESVNIGIFLNVEFKTDAIQGEMWINIAEAKKKGFNDVLERLEQGEVMEVSTGLYAYAIEAQGTYNSVSYALQISEIRPDHLALLPDEIGACSVAHGCGTMRSNHTREMIANCGNNTACACGNHANPKAILEANSLLATLRNHYFTSPLANEESHDKIRASISRALRETVSPNDWSYVVEVYDNHFIYELSNKLYKQSYTLDDSGNAILVGQAKEVKVVTSYVPVSAETITNMKPERKTALVIALATALIGNAAAVTDENKKSLESMSDDMLNNMAKAHNINLDDDGKPVVANVATPPPLPTVVAPVANTGISDEERQLLNTLKAEKETRLTNKRAAVKAINPAYTDAIVNGMDEPALDATLAVNNAQAPDANNVYGIGGNTPVTNTNNNPQKRERVSFALAKPTA